MTSSLASHYTRRDYLQTCLRAAAGSSFLGAIEAVVAGEGATPQDELSIAPFRFDVTPPLGHPLCGGWVKHAEAVEDPLEAIGFVLLGHTRPIVLCAVDWVSLLNEAHVHWREALAEAAGTTPDHVAVHCGHQHDAPFACLEAERTVAQQGDLPHILDLGFYGECLERARAAVQTALRAPQRVTHIAHGQAKVEKVASNRRIFRAADGQVQAMRGSSCRDSALRALPVGLIDPWLKTVAFYNGKQKLVACHYYASHPQSYWGTGRVNSDFPGLARKRRQQDEPDCTHIYFTGCAGNVAAGKYNDGSPKMRPILAQRVYDGIVQSEAHLEPEPIERIAWHTREILPGPRKGKARGGGMTKAAIEARIANPDVRVVDRNIAAYMLSWRLRLEKQIPIVLSSLQMNDVSLLHLPAECFVEYQLDTQALHPERWIATAAYGDGGPWYIPTQEEYAHGGYEVSVSFCDPATDRLLRSGIRTVVEPSGAAG